MASSWAFLDLDPLAHPTTLSSSSPAAIVRLCHVFPQDSRFLKGLQFPPSRKGMHLALLLSALPSVLSLAD